MAPRPTSSTATWSRSTSPASAPCATASCGKANSAWPISRCSSSARLLRCDRTNDQRRDHGHRDVEEQRAESDIKGIAGSAEAERRKRLQPVAPGGPRSPADAGGPAEQQALGAEPACVQAKHQRRKGLQYPESAQQLQVERILRRQEQDEGERPDLDDQRRDLCNGRFAGMT